MSVIGWEIEDNDPRMVGRVLTIDSAISGAFGITHFMCKDRGGRKFRIAADRIFEDSKPRRYGFNLRMRKP